MNEVWSKNNKEHHLRKKVVAFISPTRYEIPIFYTHTVVFRRYMRRLKFDGVNILNGVQISIPYGRERTSEREVHSTAQAEAVAAVAVAAEEE